MMGKRVGTGAMTGWWDGLSKDERKAFMKAQLAFKKKKTQAKMNYLEIKMAYLDELQKIFG
jgi:hypothetical protein